MIKTNSYKDKDASRLVCPHCGTNFTIAAIDQLQVGMGVFTSYAGVPCVTCGRTLEIRFNITASVQSSSKETMNPNIRKNNFVVYGTGTPDPYSGVSFQSSFTEAVMEDMLEEEKMEGIPVSVPKHSFKWKLEKEGTKKQNFEDLF